LEIIMNANKVLRSALKTAMCFLEQGDEFADDARERFNSGVKRARRGISNFRDDVRDQASDLRDRAHDLYYGEDHTGRNVLLFLVGVGVGVGAGMLLAPASGEETRESLRTSINDKVEEFRGQVRDKFTRGPSAATGTEGV
jgi:gas vesicle protein